MSDKITFPPTPADLRKFIDNKPGLANFGSFGTTKRQTSQNLLTEDGEDLLTEDSQNLILE